MTEAPHEHEWVPCEKCPNTGPCACAGGICCEAQRREIAEHAEGFAAGIAAERERWRAVLAEHYLMGVNCDHDTGRDNPMCGCSRIHLGWHPSIGAARQAWLDHVTGLLTDPELTP